jgi:excisionase family DNA binding protein
MGGNDDLLTPKQAAALLGISERRVYRGLAGGALPGVRVGGRWTLRRGELLRSVGMEEAESEPSQGQGLQPCGPSCRLARALRDILRALGVRL